MESDSDFEDSTSPRGRGSSLRLAIHRARRCIRKARTERERRSNSQSSSFASELAERFPSCRSRRGSSSRAQPKTKKRRIQQWKFIPVCLQSPQTVCVLTKGVLDSLCKIGLGSKWFTTDDKLVVDIDVSAEEFHFMLICLFPPLRDLPYEMCKATGPGNSVVVPLVIDDEGMRPQPGHPFLPFFSVSQLKESIGRKGKLYIRPVNPIPRESCRLLTEQEVCICIRCIVPYSFCNCVCMQAYTPTTRIECVNCSELVLLEDIPIHKGFCRKGGYSC